MSSLRTAAAFAVATALALPATAPALAPTLPAPTAPTGPQTAVRDYAETSVTVVGHDGARYVVYVGGFGPDAVDARPSTALVQVRRCSTRNASSCTSVLNARVTLPAAAFSVSQDLAGARLATSFRGTPLSVTWTATGDAPLVPGVQMWQTPTVRVGPQRAARAVVSVFGARCTDPTAVVSHETTVSTNDLYAPSTGDVPAALRAAPAARCSAA